MAQIIKKSNDLKNKYLAAKNKAILFGVLCGAFFISFAIFGVSLRMFTIAPVLIIGFGGFGFLAGFFHNKSSSYKSGVEGEETTATILSGLPGSYVAFLNTSITYEGRSSELDAIVVGPTGVFVIETKNLNGTIRGNYENPQWIQNKIGQKGTPYSKSFYSPVKQVGTHVWRLASLLRENGINIYVNSIVFFSNPEAVVQVTGEGKTPVFSSALHGQTAILQTITENPHTYPNDTVMKAAEFINEL